MSDEIESIRSEHVQAGDAGDPHCAMCSDASYPIWPCDTAIVLARLDALTAERDDALARLAAAEAALRASQGIIHEGLHGGRPTVPEHQERCEKPACRRIRAALAGSRARAQGEGA